MISRDRPPTPHGFPFIRVDRAEEGCGPVAKARIVVSIDDAMLEGRPEPSLLQMLLVEAAAQACAFVGSEEPDGAHGEVRGDARLAGLSDVRFGRPPRPGEAIVLEATPSGLFGSVARVHATARANGEMLVEGEILLSFARGTADIIPDRQSP